MIADVQDDAMVPLSVLSMLRTKFNYPTDTFTRIDERNVLSFNYYLKALCPFGFYQYALSNDVATLLFYPSNTHLLLHNNLFRQSPSPLFPCNRAISTKLKKIFYLLNYKNSVALQYLLLESIKTAEIERKSKFMNNDMLL